MDCKYIAFLITFELYVGFFPKLPLISLNNLLFWSFFRINLRKIYIDKPFFTNQLIEWYELNKRDLPWRLSDNPYYIWLSEIILQQTRVDQGMPYYYSFVENYPQIEGLALASQDEVLKLWQGLGYYSRARNLHEAAKKILSDFGGVFPSEYKDVRSLKGVGNYTAAAIMSFAYNKPYAAVDGNVYRVLSRVFGVDEYIDTSAGKKVFQELADELLDQDQPGVFNQAMMDFGSLQCAPKSPNCEECPFVDSCVAYNTNRVSELPRKRGKVSVRNRYFNYLDVRVDGECLLQQRTGKDIWQNLYEFPLIETDAEVDFSELTKDNRFATLLRVENEIVVLKVEKYKHVLSHQVIYATFYRIEASAFVNENSYIRVQEIDLDNYGVSRLIHKYLEKEVLSADD